MRAAELQLYTGKGYGPEGRHKPCMRCNVLKQPVDARKESTSVDSTMGRVTGTRLSTASGKRTSIQHRQRLSPGTKLSAWWCMASLKWKVEHLSSGTPKTATHTHVHARTHTHLRVRADASTAAGSPPAPAVPCSTASSKEEKSELMRCATARTARRDSRRRAQRAMRSCVEAHARKIIFVTT